MLDINLQVRKEILTNCPSCASTKLAEWCKGYDRLHRINLQEFTYSQCSSCNLIFLSERPIESEIDKFYPQNYGPYHGSFYVSDDQMKRISKNVLYKGFKTILWQFSKIINLLIRKLLKEDFWQKYNNFYNLDKFSNDNDIAFLDFGCGSDQFLNKAKVKGWNTIGMDFSLQAIEQVRSSGHKAIWYNSESAWDEIEDDSLDFVRMNHVLEHLYHPKEVLQKLRCKMKKGATLHIAIPNPSSFSAQLFKNKWRGLECPRHIMLYSPKVLEEILLKIGFDNANFLFEILTKDFARSLGFYEYEKGWISHSEIEQKINDVRLSEIVYPLARFAAIIGKSDRFHAFVTK